MDAGADELHFKDSHLYLKACPPKKMVVEFSLCKRIRLLELFHCQIWLWTLPLTAVNLQLNI